MRSPAPLLLILILLFQGCERKPLNKADDSFFALPIISEVDHQPLTEHVRRIARQLEYLGSPLDSSTLDQLEQAYQLTPDSAAVERIQSILDPLCIAGVTINPESRVKAQQGPAKPQLYEAETKRYLVKITNEAGVTARLQVGYTGASKEQMQHHGQHMQMSETETPLFHVKTYLPGGKWLNAPGVAPLTGLEVNYAIMDIFCNEAGKREITFSFDVGQGTQDLGFRAELPILFTSEPTYPLILTKVLDENGNDAVASFVIRDEQGQVFPAQSTRTPPDFWFQDQVYRSSGAQIRLPNGNYYILAGRGPEYELQFKQVEIDNGPESLRFNLERWVDPSLFGYWSGDHHIHAAGCAHYTVPTEGVQPKDMLIHIQGEDLKVGSVLTWGPGFDYQKQFFSGDTHESSPFPYTMRYDVEVSGFGSHRSGHLVLLRLKEQIFPGGESYEHWPTLGLNTLKWAQKQGAVCGPAHSGYGINLYLDELPNYEVPPYDSIGANEFVVQVTHEVEGPNGTLVPAVDFLSTGNTWPVAELNMWYHTLNAGFTPRISGETDFPCITGSHVGIWRSYVRLEGMLTYDDWCEGISKGTNYVSDGFSHLIDFKVNGLLAGEGDSTVHLDQPGNVSVSVKAIAHLKENHEQFTNFYFVPDSPFTPTPWSIERAVKDDTVDVEIIVNGYPVETKTIAINSDLADLKFEVDITQSSWIATRIFPSAHSNPIWVTVDDHPVRASKRSVEWLLKGVDQCWKSKKQFYDEDEMDDAIAAYDHARESYKTILAQTLAP